MRTYSLAFLLLLSAQLFAQKPAIIPIPVKADYPAGTYNLPKSIIIATPKEEALAVTVKNLANKLSNLGGRKVQVLSSSDNSTALANIRLNINSASNTAIGKEGYTLQVDAKGIQIAANTAKGLFYGIQTFYQLLPKEVEATKPVSITSVSVPFAKITDYPRFEWRGMMFDVARHFFGKDDVKKFIDEMAQYK